MDKFQKMRAEPKEQSAFLSQLSTESSACLRKVTMSSVIRRAEKTLARRAKAANKD